MEQCLHNKSLCFSNASFGNLRMLHLSEKRDDDSNLVCLGKLFLANESGRLSKLQQD